MGDSPIQFRATREIPVESVVALYQAVGWSAGEKLEVLCRALANSHSLITAWDRDKLAGEFPGNHRNTPAGMPALVRL
jgi:hypothetical protein